MIKALCRLKAVADDVDRARPPVAPRKGCVRWRMWVLLGGQLGERAMQGRRAEEGLEAKFPVEEEVAEVREGGQEREEEEEEEEVVMSCLAVLGPNALAKQLSTTEDEHRGKGGDANGGEDDENAGDGMRSPSMSLPLPGVVPIVRVLDPLRVGRLASESYYRDRVLHRFAAARCRLRPTDDTDHPRKRQRRGQNYCFSLCLQQPTGDIDYAFGCRLLHEYLEMRRLTVQSAWLSTIGGGHFLCHHLQHALRLAKEHAQVAKSMGDMVLFTKCEFNRFYNLVLLDRLDEAESLLGSLRKEELVQTDTGLRTMLLAAEGYLCTRRSPPTGP